MYIREEGPEEKRKQAAMAGEKEEYLLLQRSGRGPEGWKCRKGENERREGFPK